MKKIIIMLAFAIPFLSGCATIVGEKTQSIPISSTPSDAAVSITDETGNEIFKGMTPTTVTLQKSDGSYFGKKSFVVTISKDGYETQQIPVTASATGYYIAGNLLFGGIIGWLIIDPMSGAMYHLSPETITANLPGKMAHNNHARDGSIAIMLIEDVPASLREDMKKLN